MSSSRAQRRSLTARTHRLTLRRMTIAVVGVLPIVLAACSSGGSGGGGGGASSGGNAGGTITIGFVSPLTGEVALDGQLEKNGATLAMDQINAAGGINGQQLAIQFEDGACDPAATASAAQRLITSSKVAVLEGAYCSSATAAMLPLAERYQVPLVSANSSAKDLTEQGNQWFSRMPPPDAIMAQSVVPDLIQIAGIKKAAILTFNDDYGLSYAQGYEAALKANGVDVVSVDAFGSNTQDFSPFITKIQSSGADSIFVAADTGPTASLFKQLAQQLPNYAQLTKASAQPASSQQFIQLAGKSAAEGIYVSTPYVAASQVAANAQFVSDYTAKYGVPPEADAGNAYTSINIIADALKSAGTSDAQAIQDAIRATSGAYVTGDVSFNAQGQGSSTAFLVQIVGSELKIVRTIQAQA